MSSLILKCPSKAPQNVGDSLSLPIAQHFFTDDVTVISETQEVPNLMLVGSLIHECDIRTHLCGMGLILPHIKCANRPDTVHAVRGPLTRYFLQRQGVLVPEIYGDPGVLLPEVIPPSDDAPEYAFGLIPHYVDKKRPVVELLRMQGVHILDVFAPVAEFVQELQKCEVLLFSSLHGIILAHAYGRKALWVWMSNDVIGNGFKFYDYYLSIGVSPEEVPRANLTEDKQAEKLGQRATVHSHKELKIGLLQAFKGVKADLLGL